MHVPRGIRDSCPFLCTISCATVALGATSCIQLLSSAKKREAVISSPPTAQLTDARFFALRSLTNQLRRDNVGGILKDIPLQTIFHRHLVTLSCRGAAIYLSQTSE